MNTFMQCPPPRTQRAAGPDRPSPKLLSVRQFYDAFDGAVGLNTIYELVRATRIKSIRLGRKLLIPASEVEAWPQRELKERAGQWN